MNIDRVEFLRTGGIAGIPLQLKLESQSLTNEEWETLAKLIDAVGFFDLPQAQHQSARGADRFSYEITVAADGKQHTVKTKDPVPESIADLISFLVGIAKRQKRQSK